MFWPAGPYEGQEAWGCRASGHTEAAGQSTGPWIRELGIPAPTGLATRRATQRKDVFSLSELTSYFYL